MIKVLRIEIYYMASNATIETTESDSLSLVDCDLHQSYANEDEIIKYLPDRYKSRGIVLPELLYRHESSTSVENRHYREDSDANSGWKEPTEERPAGSDYEAIRKNHLDKHDVSYALLTHQTDLTINGIPNRDYAFELARAVNEYTITEWLPRDDRFLASLLVSMENPKKSAEMIREMGEHPRVRQVLVQSAAGRNPFGQPYYWPVYKAAEELGLPIGVHLSSTGAGLMNPVTAAGHPNNSIEWGTLVPAVYQGLLASLISEGVFEKYPDLKVALIEGGYRWIPGFMWRMDGLWKARRSQVPWLEKRPSEYIYDNVRFTTQPAHMPEDPHNLTKLLDSFRAEELLMFSSDYPHWDADEPNHALPPGLSEEAEKRIYYKNAQELYDLPDDSSEVA